ncbi:hypothetical protein [Streptomyces sp. NBC_01465]|uniref:hypothetical protein n=1 Tax=Streptomyces sp. NBC_01465 TaxID=2903878 RepID=UPI002E3694D5|nr:hypothetical protein [Streptomyces sp. NBC_01465]
MRAARTAGALSVAVLVALSATACGSDDTPSSVASKAGDVVSSATAKAGEAVASATAAASSKMAEVKDGVDAKDDVKAGDTKTDGDRSTAEITATNGTDKTVDYTVTVNFKDKGGNLLDVVVMNIDGVEAGKSKSGTARSNRDLGGDATAEVGQALRH